jgi:hypothetical protein
VNCVAVTFDWKKRMILNRHFALNTPACIFEEVEKDTIIINLVSGRYYNIRGGTVTAWNAIISGLAPHALIADSVENASVKDALLSFVDLLIQEHLIVEVANQSNNLLTIPVLEFEVDEVPFKVEVFTDMEEMLRLDPIHDADTDLGWPHKA